MLRLRSKISANKLFGLAGIKTPKHIVDQVREEFKIKLKSLIEDWMSEWYNTIVQAGAAAPQISASLPPIQDIYAQAFAPRPVEIKDIGKGFEIRAELGDWNILNSYRVIKKPKHTPYSAFNKGYTVPVWILIEYGSLSELRHPNIRKTFGPTFSMHVENILSHRRGSGLSVFRPLDISDFFARRSTDIQAGYRMILAQHGWRHGLIPHLLLTNAISNIKMYSWGQLPRTSRRLLRESIKDVITHNP